jgi:alkyl sulfatase BDS1-like metallo-beta-lactamase superfamily hydrolase
MGNVRDAAERLWTGVDDTRGLNPLMTFHGIEEMADGVAFVSTFANVIAINTADGLVLVDTGSFMTGKVAAQQVRSWSTEPVHTAIYTHGHADHVCGIRAFEADGDIRVVAHEAVAARFDRYKATAGYNGHINSRQFRMPNVRWPTDYRYPDETYRDALDLDVGGVTMRLFHDRGETDDHTWVYLPAQRTICTGDLFIWASPNCGNPQKVQRYPAEWAAALDKMAALDAELLLPGHGPPIIGADRVRQALTETSALLTSLHGQTLAMMNDGARLDDILHSIEIPAELIDRPYLRPVYDEPVFIVRNIWRLYGGWYDGNPARLKPAPDRELAASVVGLAGGAAALAERALAAAEAGDLRVASQLAEWAVQAAPDDAEAKSARASIYRKRADEESSLMARSIFLAAAEDRS